MGQLQTINLGVRQMRQGKNRLNTDGPMEDVRASDNDAKAVDQRYIWQPSESTPLRFSNLGT